jgi:hypothetical protein
MPLLRYFLFVGGSLIALLFVVNVAFPTAPLPENLTSGSDLPPIRIHSERKLPERVVIDTSVALPMQATAARVAIAQVKPRAQIQVQTPAQADAPALQTNVRAPVQPAIAAISAKARVREAFAQLPREEDAFEPKMSDMATVVLPEPKMYPARLPLKRKVAAKPRSARPLMVAQQPRLGGFNSTW